MTDPNENFIKTFEFKGIEIKPLSYARRACALSVCNLSAPTFLDPPTFIYACICPETELTRARRKPEAFDTAVNKWIEEVRYTEKDAEEAGNLIKALLENSEADKAQPLTDESLQSDPNS